MRAWKSGVWSLSGQGFHVLVNLGILAILGRLLTPEQFGLFGLLLAVQALVQPVLDMGLLPAYLKLENADEQASNAFFTVNVIVGLAAGLVLILVSPLVAGFYGEESLNELLVVFSLSVLLMALSGQPKAVLSRSKRFDLIVVAQACVVLVGGATAVLMAWQGYGVWTLVGRTLVETAVSLVLLVMLSGRRYRIVGPASIRPYLHDIRYGMEIVWSRLLNGWITALDKLVLGKFASLGDLGGYTRSQQLALMPNGNIRTSITTPALAHLARRSGGATLEDYLLLYWITVLLAGMPCLLLVVFGDVLLPLLLGQQWIELGWVLQWLGLLGLARVLQGLSTIYHMDRKVVRRTSLYLLGSVMGVLAVPVVILLWTGSFGGFVKGIACMSLLYWFAVLAHSMLKDWAEQRGKILNVVLRMSIVLAVPVVIMGPFRYYLAPELSPGNIDLLALGGGCALFAVVTLVVFRIFAIEESRRLIEMARGSR